MVYTLESVLRQIESVSCVEADESSIFIGTRDGHLLHYVIHKDDPESDSLEFTYLLASRQDAPGGKAPKRILLLPAVQLVAVLANELVSFYSLPEFAPASDLRTVKDVQGMLLNNDLSCRTEPDGSASLTVYTRKKIRQLKISRSAIRLAKEVEYLGCIAACQMKSIVCVATKASYDLLDLDKKAKIPLFPVVQGESDPSGPQYKPYRPRIASVSSDEFLLASGSPESPTSMGIFITLEGEMTRGTLMFDAYPKQIITQFPHIIVLLSNHTVEVHDITSQALLQSFPVSETSNLTQTTFTLPVVLNKHLNKIIKRRNRPLETEKENLSDLNTARSISDVASRIMVHDQTNIKALLSDSILLKMDDLLNQDEMQQALSMGTALTHEVSPVYAERLFNELAYVHQRAGLLYFNKMLFDDVIENFNKGDLDPRILISLFPEFQAEAGDVSVYAGVYDTIVAMDPVGVVIQRNLSQTVADQETLAELTVILRSNALEMLRRYLTQYREKKQYNSASSGSGSQQLFTVVDRTLLTLLLNMDRTESKIKLREFFKTDVEGVDGLADILKSHSRWHYLAGLYAQNGMHREALEIWKGLETSDLVDEDHVTDLDRVKDYLLQYGDDSLIWDFGIWLVRHSLELGIELFSAALEKSRISYPIQNVLAELKSDPQDRVIYVSLLEHLVVKQKFEDQDLIDELLCIYSHSLTEELKNEQIKVAMTNIINAYRVLPVPKISYLAYLADVQFSTEQEDLSKFDIARRKLVELLQNSADYDAQAILNIVLQEKSVLLAERILLYGRLSNHADSLNLLVHDLKDFDSAEVYCYHGGISLSQIRICSNKVETVAMRRQLFPLLFSEYLKLEDYSMQFRQGSKLLNRWGNYMDVAVILQLVPDHWSVELVSGFLIGSLAQLSGEKRDAQIRRSLTRAGTNRRANKQYIKFE